MIILVSQYIAAALMVIGALFSLLAGIGILRLPDLYTRMHAASKAGVVGAGLVLFAIAMASGDGPVVLRAILGILFLLLTTPVAAHLLARAAYRAGHQPASITIINDLERETSETP
ncbi:MAG: monovalent cation/H(+) antiporter subunit G [Devosia sp.]|nr:monovalent cation/H(+) antiporter subunit G [Devosia sp.]